MYVFDYLRFSFKTRAVRSPKIKCVLHVVRNNYERIEMENLEKSYIRMYYRSGTGGPRCIGTGQTLSEHSPGSSTFLREMTSWESSWNYDIKSKIPLRQSICVVSKRTTKFYPDSIWNDRLRLYWRGCPNKNKTNRNWVAIWDQCSWSKNYNSWLVRVSAITSTGVCTVWPTVSRK